MFNASELSRKRTCDSFNELYTLPEEAKKFLDPYKK